MKALLRISIMLFLVTLFLFTAFGFVGATALAPGDSAPGHRGVSMYGTAEATGDAVGKTIEPFTWRRSQ